MYRGQRGPGRLRVAVASMNLGPHGGVAWAIATGAIAARIRRFRQRTCANPGGPVITPRIHFRAPGGCGLVGPLEIEDRVQSAVQADQRRNFAYRQQSPSGVRAGAAPRVVPERQPLVRHAKDDLSTDDVPGQAYRMHLGAGDGSPPGLPGAQDPVDRDRGLGVTYPGETGGQFADGPAWRVDLVAVRIVNDLPVRDEPGGGLSESQQQRGGQGEVAAGEDASMLCRAAWSISA